MYPIIFEYKFITIGSYGIMLGLAFYLSFILLERELSLHKKDPELAYKIIITVIPCAIIGAKIFHIIDYWENFIRDPFGSIFSGTGLSVLGGFVLSFIVTFIVIKKNNESVLEIYDITSPAMALGYALGRFGCHAAGDSCYGIATKSILGNAYPNAISPVSVTVYPTALYESLFAFLVLLFLLQLRKRENPTGRIFFVYLILMGIPRFFVEFIRTNPKIAIGLSQAQFISLSFIVIGLFGLGMIKVGFNMRKV